MKIEPKCLNGEMDVAFINKGYFVPCCWCDKESVLEDLEMRGIIQDGFHISQLKAAKDIHNVLNSAEWNYFKRNLEKNQNVPKICYQSCGIDQDGKNIKERTKRNR